ncbi:TetR/AcrR family transcriptional regulator [Aureimonas jatrophae]|jgi:AcrR family transcriptional regulator|uniref:DNA-binding transcriptional regulator, AcrR family n=1 Tax=Aureimonas jatrophae TaxID=1166073 RepID=A0A1H0EHA2_9HYPH|nr:TetR/AcrR family transcriptional regulator [Aureimonas jatrophae]MBB3952832.1 AcrR family transcriptional regulator [Aureimonas jatrophae]SDN81814.1 DNA-binding transcriptional regulator, AcrR family [Aureimonas jatrophae]
MSITTRRARSENKKTLLREESVRRLTASAVRLIVEKGYHASTLQEIADGAGLTKGAIFFYFDSKENLLLNILDRAEMEIVDTLIEHLDTLQTTAAEKIAAFFRFTSQQGISRPYELLCLIKMSIEGRNSTELADKRVYQIYERIRGKLEEIVREGKSTGEFAPSLPSSEFASVIIAMHDGMMLEWHRRGKDIDGKILVRTVWKTILNGVVVKQPTEDDRATGRN